MIFMALVWDKELFEKCPHRAIINGSLLKKEADTEYLVVFSPRSDSVQYFSFLCLRLTIEYAY